MKMDYKGEKEKLGSALGLLGDYEYIGAFLPGDNSPVYRKKSLPQQRNLHLYIYKDRGKWIGQVFDMFCNIRFKLN